MKPSKYLIEKTKNAKKPKPTIYVDWKQVPKNIPLTKEFFTTPIKFNINETKDNKNVA